MGKGKKEFIKPGNKVRRVLYLNSVIYRSAFLRFHSNICLWVETNDLGSIFYLKHKLLKLKCKIKG